MQISLENACELMLKDGEREESLTDRKEIEKIFKNNGLPLFDKVIDFQVKYGGLLYQSFKGDHMSGFKMGIIYKEYPKERYDFNLVISPETLSDPYETYIVKEKDKYYFSCLNYNYAGDWGPMVDEDGRIYNFSMGCITLIAESIDEFLAYESVSYYFTSKNDNWIEYTLNSEVFEKIIKNENMKKLQNDNFTDRYMSWWVNEDETIFIKFEEKNEFYHKNFFRAEMFCSEETINKVLPISDRTHRFSKIVRD